jgi:hypothetical protein
VNPLMSLCYQLAQLDRWAINMAKADNAALSQET